MRDYTQQLTVEQFGAHGRDRDPRGRLRNAAHISATRRRAHRCPVRFDPTQAPREDRASAVLLIGTLGSREDGRGAERSSTPPSAAGSSSSTSTRSPTTAGTKLPELAGELQVLELSGDPAQQGRLDPLAIGLPDMREELACSYLLELLPGPSSTWENAVWLAVKDTVREGSQSLLRVVELLATSDRPARGKPARHWR